MSQRESKAPGLAASFAVGFLASLLANALSPGLLGWLSRLDWLGWLESPLFGSGRWAIGDLALSVVGGLLVLLVVWLVQVLISHLRAQESQQDEGLPPQADTANLVYAPRVVGLEVDDAEAIIRDAGLEPQVVWDYGPGAEAFDMGRIFRQDPEGSALAPAGSLVRIYTWFETQ